MDKSNYDQDDKGKELVDPSPPSNPITCYTSNVTLYQGCWFPSQILPNVIAFRQKFQAEGQDIILASYPKSGTTWLKALLFSIANRTRYTPSDTPLLTANPQALMPHFEFTLFCDPPVRSLSDIGSPRLLATHIPYTCLPESVVAHYSKCRIVYICRNPLDTIVSFWHFNGGRLDCRDDDDHAGPDQRKMDDFVEAFCRGESEFGPFWDHVLGFWKASLEHPEKILFLKYEEMLEDTFSQAKRLAEFIGFPFSEEEERNGDIGKILELCSLKKLKELDVNKHGKSIFNYENKKLFRKGEVGDWVNHLSPSMVESVEKVIQEKLCDSGLMFKFKI